MSDSTPTFSVIIPVYNRADKLESALRSIFEQTVQDFEVIVVDDGSKDDPAAVVARVRDARVRFIRQENAGANVARNHGIDLAQGKYVAFLDSDDKFLPHHLEAAAIALGDGDVVYFARVVADRGGGRTFLKPTCGPRDGQPMAEYLCCDTGFVQTSTLVVPTRIAKQIRYLEWLPYGQDVDYALRLAQANYPFHFSEQADTIWDDVQTGKRISSGSRGAVRDRWAIENRELLTNKAFYGFRGWRSAKAYAEGGQKLKGLALFAGAALRRAYAPKQAARVFLQIALAGGGYQRLVERRLGSRKGQKR